MKTVVEIVMLTMVDITRILTIYFHISHHSTRFYAYSRISLSLPPLHYHSCNMNVGYLFSCGWSITMIMFIMSDVDRSTRVRKNIKVVRSTMCVLHGLRLTMAVSRSLVQVESSSFQNVLPNFSSFVLHSLFPINAI